MMSWLLYPILIPALCGMVALVQGNRVRGARETLVLFATLLNLWFAVSMFGHTDSLSLPWAGFGLEFSLRLYHFGGFILLATAGFAIAISLYCAAFLYNHRHANQFYSYLLISVAFTNGVALSDNLVLLLFFWEGLLLTLFGMIAIGRPGAFKSAVKALVIVGISDLCMTVGIVLTGYLAGSLRISEIHLQVNDTWTSLAFVLLMIGAISKAGAIPFHTWIPDAALDAPLPFMALLPAALEKLLGIYFLARISLDMFWLTPQSWISPLLMIIGAITILVAVMMALVQKDYKRLLSYHAISQVGYMILGIGTAVPAGIVGGLFHMINHAMYKSCLFLSGGSVEKQAGTTDLTRLGGLAGKMPITFTCYLVAAASICGVPPFNGFFSKELVYDGALMRGMPYYLAALLGSFLTAASFLKLGHSAYLGKLRDEHKDVKEAPFSMLLPMILIAGMCILFGVYNALPLRGLIQPILGERLEGHDFAGLPHDVALVVATCVVLLLAVSNHRYGVRKSGSGVGAADHIHHAPVLFPLYEKAERRFFDPYDVGLRLVQGVADLSWRIDRAVNWISDSFATGLTFTFTRLARNFQTGNYSTYLAWSLAGTLLVVWFIMHST